MHHYSTVRYIPVKKVVTSRMERYRKITEDWLKRNGIVYGELCMSVRTNAKDRKHAQGQGETPQGSQAHDRERQEAS